VEKDLSQIISNKIDEYMQKSDSNKTILIKKKSSMPLIVKRQWNQRINK
jgi:hypothetical protein